MDMDFYDPSASRSNVSSAILVDGDVERFGKVRVFRFRTSREFGRRERTHCHGFAASRSNASPSSVPIRRLVPNGSRETYASSRRHRILARSKPEWIRRAFQKRVTRPGFQRMCTCARCVESHARRLLRSDEPRWIHRRHHVYLERRALESGAPSAGPSVRKVGPSRASKRLASVYRLRSFVLYSSLDGIRVVSSWDGAFDEARRSRVASLREQMLSKRARKSPSAERRSGHACLHDFAWFSRPSKPTSKRRGCMESFAWAPRGSPLRRRMRHERDHGSTIMRVGTLSFELYVLLPSSREKGQ